MFSSAEVQALTELCYNCSGLFRSASNMYGLCRLQHPYIHCSIYGTDADIDVTKLGVPEHARSRNNHTNQKQKHPVKGDWEPRKVEGGRTASRLMTGGGDFIIKLCLREWEGYPIAPNHESLIFMPIPLRLTSLYTAHIQSKIADEIWLREIIMHCFSKHFCVKYPPHSRRSKRAI